MNNYDEDLLLSRLRDLAHGSIKSNTARYTDFLDPRQQSLVIGFFKKHNSSFFKFYGGHEEAERRVCAIYNENNEKSNIEFPIEILRLSWNPYKKIGHRDILGSILGIGIKRDKIGDIILHGEDVAYIVVHTDICTYIVHNLLKIGNTSVNIEHADSIPSYTKSIQQISSVVASMRLDCILCAGFGLSRSKAQEAIKGSRVFVNWDMKNSVSMEIKEGDMISYRGKGRIQIQSVLGSTKKDRIKISIVKYV